MIVKDTAYHNDYKANIFVGIAHLCFILFMGTVYYKCR